jgi:uncharacterized membrane protein
MNSSQVLLLAFLIGVVTGLRSLIPPAIMAWAAHRNWLDLHISRVSFMASTAAVVVFTLLALVELVADKLPSTPARTKPTGLIARTLLGGLCGACISVAGTQSVAFGTILGVAGGVAGAFGGYQVRARFVKALNVPDLYVALLEDAVTIAGGLFVVSRF